MRWVTNRGGCRMLPLATSKPLRRRRGGVRGRPLRSVSAGRERRFAEGTIGFASSFATKQGRGSERKRCCLVSAHVPHPACRLPAVRCRISNRSSFFFQRRVAGHLRSGEWLGEGQTGVARKGIRSSPGALGPRVRSCRWSPTQNAGAPSGTSARSTREPMSQTDKCWRTCASCGLPLSYCR